MKNLKKLLIRPFVLIAVLVFALSGCAKDDVNSGSDMGQEVHFTINVPGASKPATRALTDVEENQVETVEILLFHDATHATKAGELASTAVLANVITNVGGDVTKKTFSVRLPEGTFDIVVFANSRDAIRNSTQIVVGTQKTTVLGSLEKAMPATGWVADPANATKVYLIPMWGEQTGVTVASGVSLSGIYLHRMLARVDMAVTGVDPVTALFKMTDILIYNSQNKGRIVPIQNATNTNWNPTFVNPSMANAVTGVAVASSLVIGGTKLAPISYSGFIDGTGKSCLSEIYLFEATKATGDADINAPCVIIRGSLNGVDAGYYRLDFAKMGAYLDILRNHKYTISIVSVSGTGYSTPEEALSSRASNIIVNVTLWNDYDLGGIMFDGAHFVSITPQDIEYTKDAQANKKIVIKTDLGTTLTRANIKISDSPSNPDAGFAIEWIKNVTLGAPVVVDNRNVYELSYDVESNGLSPRAAYIYVTASSRLTNVVRVRQSNIVSSMLIAVDAADKAIDVIEFAAASGVDPGEKIYKIQWSPKSEIVYPSVAVVGKPEGGTYDPLKWVHYNTESGAISNNGTVIYASPIDSGTGEVTFTIKPQPITDGVDGVSLATDPFYERQEQINFRATGSEGTMRKSVVLQQYVFNMKPTVKDSYVADGGDYTFNVKSNRPWKAFLVDNGSGMVATPAVSTTEPFATGGYNLPNGMNVGFKTFNDLANPTILSGTGKVRIEWLGGTDLNNSAHWIITDIDLFCASIQPKSNSYIVAPGGADIFIPVSRANESMLGIQLGDNEAFTAELVWTDNANKIADNSNIKMIRAVGSGTGGYVLVVPGSESGNAVVAIKNAAKKILWSWHIWVTDYNPTPIGEGKFMDRNLGAFSNTSTATITDISAKGLHYQWGRKDPFPSSTRLNGYSEPTLYTATGTTAVINAEIDLVISNNFGNSVAKPATFYYNQTAPYDWYSSDWYDSSRVIQNDALWGPASKTVYDPCPDGWRVPQHGVWDGLTTTNFPWGDYGRTAASHGGFYPAAGFRSHDNGMFNNPGTYGFYWAATANGAAGYYSSFSSSSVSPSYGNDRAHGYSVRCVQE